MCNITVQILEMKASPKQKFLGLSCDFYFFFSIEMLLKHLTFFVNTFKLGLHHFVLPLEMGGKIFLKQSKNIRVGVWIKSTRQV